MIGSLLVWAVGIAGIIVMEKIAPHNVIYPIYVVMICTLTTIALTQT